LLEMNKIYNMDCRAGLKQLADESIDCVVTSPPYWGLRDYGLEPVIWDEDSECEHEWGNEQIHKTELQAGNPEFQRQWREQASGQSSSAFCSLCGAWRGSLGLEPTFQLYIAHLIQIFDEVKRVLRKDGTCWVNLGDSYSGSGGNHKEWHKNDTGFQGKVGPRCGGTGTQKDMSVSAKSLCQIPSRFAIAMTDAGWILRNELIWYKRNCMPSSAKDRFTVDFEKVFFFTKNKKYWFEQQKEPLAESTSTDHRIANEDFVEKRPDRSYPGGQQLGGGMLKPYGDFRNKRCVWDITTQPFKGAHFAVFPEKLVEPMVKAGCPEGGICLDIFMGSGTVAVVAHKLNRQFIGFDLGYEDISSKRVSRELAQCKLELGE